MNTSLSLAVPLLPIDRPAPGTLGLAERGLIPDALIRAGIRQQCRARLREERGNDEMRSADVFQQRIDALRSSAVAIETEAANRQHYEVPAAFFRQCLGPRLKYSACYYANGDESLAQAEDAMLELYAQRANLADGQQILELGCGWGSLTLWMAERFTNASILAVSNSQSQREYILGQCHRRGLGNVRVMTCDVNRLELAEAQFDRCVSIEMFEHMRNYDLLLSRIARWLRADGKLFVHIFCHRTLMYPFESEGEANWMGRHFFTGGLMPAADTLLWFQRDLRLERRWLLDGSHYARTAEHWLQNQDAARAQLMPLMSQVYANLGKLWFQRWRMFWMACAELFAYNHGREWMVAHYRFSKQG